MSNTLEVERETEGNMTLVIRPSVDALPIIEHQLGHMKILIIDDSKFQCIAMQRALGYAGYEVATAPDGELGLQAARDSHPDIIVLDMMLPKLSGIDVLRILRREAKTRAVPVIVLTGLSDRNREKLIAEGASGFLEKSEALLVGNCEPLREAIGRLALGNREVQE